MSATAHRVTFEAAEALTRHEIERRIEHVITEVSAPTDTEIGFGSADDGFRWMAPAVLVRRMRPYLSFN